MKIIKEADWPEYFNVLRIEDQRYWDIPNLLCTKCHALIHVEVMHEPKQIKIEDCRCDQLKAIQEND